ncbi:MAG TPA: hypothetical protein VM686_29425 [Polyangiaceae bacterium]|nr:hypothetical protein [Polyangiaceae bacterium]
MQWPGRLLPILAGPALGLALVFGAPAPAAAERASRSGRTPEPSDWAEPEDEDEPPRPSEPMIPVDKHFAVGLHAGIIPPTFVVPALWIRPIQHVAVGVLGMVLPKTESEPTRWTVGGLMRIDFTNSNEDSPYCSLGYYRYREDAVRDGLGLVTSGVTTTVVPLTFGYLWRGSFVEGQLGGGLLFWSERADEPVHSSLDFGFDSPPILPALEAALRYRF